MKYNIEMIQDVKIIRSIFRCFNLNLIEEEASLAVASSFLFFKINLLESQKFGLDKSSLDL